VPTRKGRLTALLVSDATTLLGAAMAVTATPFVVLAAGGTQADLAWVAIAVLSAEISALAVGGVLADRISRHWVMMGSDLLQAAASAAVAIAFSVGAASATLVIGLSALRGLGLGLFLPASQGILPQIVDPARLTKANSLRRVTANIAQIGGALAGGVLVTVVGPGPAMGAITVAFLLGAACRAGLRGLPARTEPAESLLSAARSGFREFASRRWLWSVVLGFAVVNAAFIGCVSVLGPLTVSATLGGASSWGAIAAATAAGAVLGSALAYPWRPKRPLVVAVLFAVPLAAEPATLASGVFPAALVGAAAAGLGMEVFGVLWVSVLQQHVPTEALSRVSAFDAMGSFAVSPLGPLAAGLAAAAFGVPFALMATSALIAVVCGCLLLIPDIRQVTGLPRTVGARQPVARPESA
jgi:MFS family permease